MSFIFNDKVFFVMQGLLKYNAFGFGVKLRAFFYRPFFKKFGKNVQIQDAVTIKYPSDLEIGNNVKVGQYCFFVGKGGLTIGNNVLIGAGTKIITSNHNFEDIDKPITEQGLSFVEVLIENDVWFGFDVKVLGGSTVRTGTIVATNSVINGKDFPAYTIIGGTPATVIKHRKEKAV